MPGQRRLAVLLAAVAFAACEAAILFNQEAAILFNQNEWASPSRPQGIEQRDQPRDPTQLIGD